MFTDALRRIKNMIHYVIFEHVYSFRCLASISTNMGLRRTLLKYFDIIKEIFFHQDFLIFAQNCL